MQSNSLNIVLLPDENATQIAIDLSKELSKKTKTNFILNGNDLIPHLTIYQAEFPVANTENVINQVDDLVQKINPFTLDMGGFSHTPEGNIWWNSIFIEPMATLQKEVVNRCNSLRDGLLLPGLNELKDKGTDYKNEIEKYGSLWLFNRYIPHISLIAVDPELNDETMKQLNFEKKVSFNAEKIALGTLGKYGTVTSIIKEFKIN